MTLSGKREVGEVNFEVVFSLPLTFTSIRHATFYSIICHETIIKVWRHFCLAVGGDGPDRRGGAPPPPRGVALGHRRPAQGSQRTGTKSEADNFKNMHALPLQTITDGGKMYFKIRSDSVAVTCKL